MSLLHEVNETIMAALNKKWPNPSPEVVNAVAEFAIVILLGTALARQPHAEATLKNMLKDISERN